MAGKFSTGQVSIGVGLLGAGTIISLSLLSIAVNWGQVVTHVTTNTEAIEDLEITDARQDASITELRIKHGGS